MLKNKKSAWQEHPNYKIDISKIDKHICVLVNYEVIADSKQALLLCEQDHEPVYYFPREDVRFEKLHIIDTITYCPYKGEATHWALNTYSEQLKPIAWSYTEPFAQVNAIKSYVAFYPDVLDHIIVD